jgi:LCP family protein required for cell wall assembly
MFGRRSKHQEDPDGNEQPRRAEDPDGSAAPPEEAAAAAEVVGERQRDATPAPADEAARDPAGGMPTNEAAAGGMPTNGAAAGEAPADQAGEVDAPGDEAAAVDLPPPSGAERPLDVPTVAPTPAPIPDPVPVGASQPRRTVPQYLVLLFNSLVAIGCLLAAGLVWYGNHTLGETKRVIIPTAGSAPPPATAGPSTSSAATGATGTTLAPVVVPPGDVNAQNILLTGADNNSCVDPNSPYAGAFGDRSSMGERSDAIIILRIDPTTNQAAILSFPRDLWVKVAGTGNRSRINAAWDRQDPTRLIETIYNNFQIPIDHYIGVDFCAFKNIVDAIGGVSVPFQFAARDENTGLNVQRPECHAMQGDEALAYVRSRHYEYFDPQKQRWVSDGTSDFGRITRQQDFIKRVLQKAIDKGSRNPAVAKKLIDAVIKGVTLDANLTIDKLLQVSNAMRDFDPAKVRTFQVEGRGMVVGNGAQVLQPVTNTKNMKAILEIFRGQASMADAPEQSLTPVSTLPPVNPSDVFNTPTTTSTTSSNGSAEPGATTTTLPPISVQENNKGIYPPADLSCR